MLHARFPERNARGAEQISAREKKLRRMRHTVLQIPSRRIRIAKNANDQHRPMLSAAQWIVFFRQQIGHVVVLFTRRLWVYQLDATLFRGRGDVIMNIVRHEKLMARIISGSTPRQASQPCHVQAM